MKKPVILLITVLAAVLVVALVCLWWVSPWHPVPVFGLIVVLAILLWIFFAQWDDPPRGPPDGNGLRIVG